MSARDPSAAQQARKERLLSRPLPDGLAGQVRARRESAGFSQAELSAKSGLSRVAISLIERGHKPSLATLEKLAAAMKCTAADLLTKEMKP